jgi:hypothetical protein
MIKPPKPFLNSSPNVGISKQMPEIVQAINKIAFAPGAPDVPVDFKQATAFIYAVGKIVSQVTDDEDNLVPGWYNWKRVDSSITNTYDSTPDWDYAAQEELLPVYALNDGAPLIHDVVQIWILHYTGKFMYFCLAHTPPKHVASADNPKAYYPLAMFFDATHNYCGARFDVYGHLDARYNMGIIPNEWQDWPSGERSIDQDDYR